MTHSRPSIPVFATTLLFFVTPVRRCLDLRRFHASWCYRPLGLCAKISENPQYFHILFARMGCHYRRSARVWALVLGYLLLETTQHATAWGINRIEPAEACADFAPGKGYPESAWTLDDCIEVWTQFSDTMPQGQHRRLPYVDTWRDTAIELRRAGSPCLAASNPSGDGAGSSTIRHLASWIFAEEMGCDWVTPDWGKRHVGAGNGTVMYCHRTATVQEMDNPDPSDGQELHHCSVVDWLAYFQFDVPSVSLPDHGTVEVIQTGLGSKAAIERVKAALLTDGLSDPRWDHVVFAFEPSFASQHLASVGNWDDARRDVVRRVLQEARKNFHVHPRPWYDEDLECAYAPDRLNFGLHVRMGDRRAFQEGTLEYFELLEGFMDTVSTEVVNKGLQPPLFHIFSETLVPCPSLDTGLFDEFPAWPVELDQVPACLAAKTPSDCPKKRAGLSCSPTRSGIFHVRGKPIVLHVGEDVQNALSCMIQADGLLMGCSTFGQVAGLLSKGISFFSMHCSGGRTPTQYKTIPPFAIAERGHLWVPVAGSWRDPVLTSTDILRSTLDTFISARNA